MNFPMQFILGRQLALNQGVSSQQATSDGLITALLKQPMGLVLALFLARNQAAAAPAAQAANPSVTSLGIVPQHPATGVAITITATVVSTNLTVTANPTGSVVIEVRGVGANTWVLQAPLLGGTAIVSVPALPAGQYSVSATYFGDATYQGSTGTVTPPLQVVDAGSSSSSSSSSGPSGSYAATSQTRTR
jgi:Bacterial Ig-like domain (group 3)